MNRDHRRIIHDLAQVYGLESVSYDSEPKRNVVVTAVRWVGLAVRESSSAGQARHWESLRFYHFLLLAEEGKEIHFPGIVFLPSPKDPSQRAKCAPPCPERHPSPRVSQLP